MRIVKRVNIIKKKLFAVLGGLYILLPSVVVAQLPGGNWARGDANAFASGLPTGTIYGIIATGLSWLLSVLGFIVIIGFLISGILFLTAAGSEAQLERAKSSAWYSIIGVIVALMGYVIVQAINSWLGTSASF